MTMLQPWKAENGIAFQANESNNIKIMKTSTNPKTLFSLTVVLGAGALLGLTACDDRSADQKTTAAKQEAVQKINEAQAEADQKKLEATQQAQKEIADAQRKALEQGSPPAVAPPPPPVIPPPTAPPTPGSTVDKIENKVKDALNVRPNEGVKDALEEKAENAKDAADDAAARADEAASRAAEAAKKAGQ